VIRRNGESLRFHTPTRRRTALGSRPTNFWTTALRTYPQRPSPGNQSPPPSLDPGLSYASRTTRHSARCSEPCSAGPPAVGCGRLGARTQYRTLESLPGLPFPVTHLDYLGDLDTAGLAIAVNACATAERAGVPAAPATQLWALLIDQPSRADRQIPGDEVQRLTAWLPEKIRRRAPNSSAPAAQSRRKRPANLDPQQLRGRQGHANILAIRCR